MRWSNGMRLVPTCIDLVRRIFSKLGCLRYEVPKSTIPVRYVDHYVCPRDVDHHVAYDNRGVAWCTDCDIDAIPVFLDSVGVTSTGGFADGLSSENHP